VHFHHGSFSVGEQVQPAVGDVLPAAGGIEAVVDSQVSENESNLISGNRKSVGNRPIDSVSHSTFNVLAKLQIGNKAFWRGAHVLVTSLR